MSKHNPGVVSGVWNEWDGIGGPNGAAMVATGAQHDTEDAEKSVRRLGIDYSTRDQHIIFVSGWVGVEDQTFGNTQYACDINGIAEDETVLDKLSVSYVTFAVIVDSTNN